MSIKLIALDLDGTFLSNGMDVSQRNINAVKQAVSKGIHVVICTGRAFGEIPKSVRNIKEIEYFITSNGASVTNRYEKIVYSNPMPREISDIAIEKISRSECMLDLYIDNKAYMQESQSLCLEKYGLTDKFYNMLINSRIKVEDIKKFYREQKSNVEKINLFFADISYREKIIRRLSTLSPAPNMTYSLKNNLEITSSTCNKGSGLESLCRILNVDRSEVMAVGDSNNDLSMLKFAGYSFAMDNAPDYIKDAAVYVTGSYMDDGAALAIEWFI